MIERARPDVQGLAELGERLETLRRSASVIMQQCVDARLAGAENQRRSYLQRACLSEAMTVTRLTIERSQQLRSFWAAQEKTPVLEPAAGDGAYCVKPIDGGNTSYLMLSAAEAIHLVLSLKRCNGVAASCSTVDGRSVTLMELKLLSAPRPILYDAPNSPSRGTADHARNGRRSAGRS